MLAIVGIPIVVVAVAVVALTTGSGDANPTGTLAIIFAIVGGFVFLLLFVQGREIARGRADGRATRRGSRASPWPTR